MRNGDQDHHLKSSPNYINKSSDSALDNNAARMVNTTNVSSKVVSTVFNQPQTVNLSMAGGLKNSDVAENEDKIKIDQKTKVDKAPISTQMPIATEIKITNR